MTRKPLASIEDMAEHYDVSVRTVRDWRLRKVGPGVLLFRVGRRVRARWEDIDRFDAEQVRRAA